MSEELESLRAEVAALRAEVADERARATSAISRRRLLTGLAGVGAVTAAGVATGARPARAAAGDNVVLGEDNVSDVTTRMLNGGSDDLPDTGFTTPVLYIADSSGAEGAVIRSSDTALVSAGELHGVVASGSVGVEGSSTVFAGVAGMGEEVAAGVVGQSTEGPALYLDAADGVHLKVIPKPSEGPPESSPSWPPEPGEIVVDSSTDIWLCTAAGDPPTWTRLLREDTAAGRVVPITPVRVLDSRFTNGRPAGSPVVPGQKKGPLLGGQAITLGLAGVGDIPASASGVVGNLTVVSPSYNGYLTAAPSGSTSNTSSLNFTKDTIVANAFTSALGPDGLTIRASGTTANRYELVVDITAYIS